MQSCLSLMKQSRGFSLTELAIVIGIVGIILGGIWEVTSVLRHHMKIDKAVQETATLAQNIRNLYADKTTFKIGIMTTPAIKAGVFPADMIDNTGIPTNPWGGTSACCAPIPGSGVSIGSQDGLGFGLCPQDTRKFDIMFWGVPNDSCIEFLSRLIGPAADPNIVCIYADGAGLIANPATATLSQVKDCDSGIIGGINVLIDMKK